MSNKNILDPSLKEEIFTYWSEDKRKKAVLMNNYGEPEIHFFNNGELEAIENYENNSMRFYEDAAENYVIGVKTFS